MKALLLAALPLLAASCANRSELPVHGRLPWPSLEKAGLGDLRGKVWVAGFIFTRCAGPCPLITNNMAALQRKLPKEALLVSFTVDPDYDTRAALDAYAGRFGADPARWRFVTGKRRDLYALYQDGFKLPVSLDPKAPPSLRAAHSAKLALVDGEGAIRGYYDGEDASALEGLPRDAAFLLRKSS